MHTNCVSGYLTCPPVKLQSASLKVVVTSMLDDILQMPSFLRVSNIAWPPAVGRRTTPVMTHAGNVVAPSVIIIVPSSI